MKFKSFNEIADFLVKNKEKQNLLINIDFISSDPKRVQDFWCELLSVKFWLLKPTDGKIKPS